MTFRPRIGILGGTLDPVHVGHLEAAIAAARALALDRVLLMPSRVPPHRPQQPAASAYHRFAMAALAVNGMEGLEASALELGAGPTPSYTANTLVRLHEAGLTPVQIFFITGTDAFAEIETWRRYPQVLDLSHFVVVSRPGYRAPTLQSMLPALAVRMAAASPEAASATKPAIFLLDVPTADISSTEIRRRLRAGQPVQGLVPEAVEKHIRQHELYIDGSYSHLLDSTADHLHDQD